MALAFSDKGMNSARGQPFSKLVSVPAAEAVLSFD
jgi:hypothetical protein